MIMFLHCSSWLCLAGAFNLSFQYFFLFLLSFKVNIRLAKKEKNWSFKFVSLYLTLNWNSIFTGKKVIVSFFFLSNTNLNKSWKRKKGEESCSATPDGRRSLLPGEPKGRAIPPFLRGVAGFPFSMWKLVKKNHGLSCSHLVWELEKVLLDVCYSILAYWVCYVIIFIFSYREGGFSASFLRASDFSSIYFTQLMAKLVNWALSLLVRLV